MRAAWTVLGATALLFGLGWWRWQGDLKVAAPALSTDLDEPEPERTQAAELSALRARVARLEEQLSALHKAGSAGDTGCSRLPSPGLAPQLPLVAVAEPLPAPDLVATFDRDPRPAQHTPQATQLESRVKALLPQEASLDRLECRGEICRVELTLPGIKRYHEFIRSAFSNPETRVWSGATKFGYLSEPDPRHWEHDEISVYAYLGPQAHGAEP